MYIEFKDGSNSIVNMENCSVFREDKEAELDIFFSDKRSPITLYYIDKETMLKDKARVFEMLQNENKFSKRNEVVKEIEEKPKHMITINGKLLDRNDVLHALLEGDYTVELNTPGTIFQITISILSIEIIEENKYYQHLIIDCINDIKDIIGCCNYLYSQTIEKVFIGKMNDILDILEKIYDIII